MNDRFYSSTTYYIDKTKTSTQKQSQSNKYIDYNKPFIDMLSNNGISTSNIYNIKLILTMFRSDYGLKFNKHPNGETLQKWLEYYNKYSE